MPLQDLTPQLRTRLSRVERAVGWFITLATLLVIVAFTYYFYQAAKRRGWFDTKIPYSTSINNVAGLKEGDPVKMMGKTVGEITEIELNEPWDYYAATVYFRIRHPYEGYIWLDSKVRITSDFLGARSFEIIKGIDGGATVVEIQGKGLHLLKSDAVKSQLQKFKEQIVATNASLTGYALQSETTNLLNAALKANPSAYYAELSKAKPLWIAPLDTPELTERLESVVNMVQSAMPNILALTNQVAATLTSATAAASNANIAIQQTQPVLSNINAITANLRDPHGSLGEWALPTNINTQLELTMRSANETLKTANATIASTDTNMTKLTDSLSQSLIQLADLTSNLNNQVQANTNLIKNISDSIEHTDDLIQGLKRHWFLRSAFKTNKEPEKITRPGRR